MKLWFILTGLLLITFSVAGQEVQYQKTENGIRAQTETIVTEISFITPAIVRVVKWPAGTDFEKKSLSVIKNPEEVAFDVQEEGSRVRLTTSVMSVAVDANDGTVSFSDHSGKALLKEKEGGSFLPFDDAGTPTFTVKQAYQLDTDEAIYGLGIQQQGKMVQRNLKLRMIQGNTDDYIPFFQSVKGYGLFWDNYSPTDFSDTPSETVFSSDVGDCIDYYFIYGGDADGVIAGMRDLTGQVPMFPLWTYGYWQSRERYKSQDETVGVVQKYRELEVPIDGIIQDWRYWGNNYLWNAMEFLNEEFYDPQKMVDDVHALNAHMIISIWNSFGPQTKPYRELDSIGALLSIKTWPESGSFKWPPNPDYPSGVRVYDAYNPVARDIYWKYLNAGIFSLGMDGWWIDSSEPDHFHPEPSDYDNPTYLGSFRKVRNAYPLMTVGGVYTHQREVSDDKRVFILTRSAFAGQQRYAANTWSGDVVASWEALRNQISAGLNFSLCGIPHFNSDIGGFFLWNFERKLDDPEYHELYTRWMQFGAFCPMMRSHGADAPREIYRFGQKGEPVYDALEKYIHLRYRLLPYIYSVSWEVSKYQSTLMRALMMDFPNDKKALDINSEYLFGKSFLVCPVTEKLYTADSTADFSKNKSTQIYLPGGTSWIDFWNGNVLEGGQTLEREVPIDIMPLYVRAGSVIPMGPQVQYATEKVWDSLEIRIYPGADGSFILYEDENDNYNYEQGVYTEIPFTWDDAQRTLTIHKREGDFPGMLKSRIFNIVIVNGMQGSGATIPEQADRQVTYEGKELKIKL